MRNSFQAVFGGRELAQSVPNGKSTCGWPRGRRNSSGYQCENFRSRIGVRPFIYCTATYTVNGGSKMLPEVISTIVQASNHHDHQIPQAQFEARVTAYAQNDDLSVEMP